MPWGIAATAVIGAYEANQQSKAAKNGAKAQTDASQAAIDEQRREYDLTRADHQQWLDFGKWAIPRQQAYLNGDTSGFMKSADYLGALQGQTQALDRSAASRGILYSGAQQGDLAALGQRLAQQYGNSYYNKLTGASDTGYNTANSLGSLGASMADNIGQQYNNIGNARQSSYAGQSNAWSNYANQLSGLAGQYYGKNSWGGV